MCRGTEGHKGAAGRPGSNLPDRAFFVRHVKASDFWIYPQPIEPGDWRCVQVNLLRYRFCNKCHPTLKRANKFAWKLKQTVLHNEPPWKEYDWDHIESGAYLDYEGEENA